MFQQCTEVYVPTESHFAGAPVSGATYLFGGRVERLDEFGDDRLDLGGRSC